MNDVAESLGLLLGCLLVAYLAFADNSVVTPVRSGAYGAVRAGAGAGARSARAQWARNRPARQARGKARRQRWRESGDPGLQFLWGLETAARGAGAVAWGAGVASREAARSARDGYRASRDNARAARQPSEPTDTPDPTPDPVTPPTPTASADTNPAPANQASTTEPQPTSEGEPPVTDITPLTETDLQKIHDLIGELNTAHVALEQLIPAVRNVDWWRGRVMERTVAADFGSPGLMAAVQAVGEAPIDVTTLVALQESVAVAVEVATRLANAVGEPAAAEGATGNVAAYTPA